MSGRADILLVGQTPPPYHGQAVVTAMLFEHDWGAIKVAMLRMSYSDKIDAVGKVSLGKLVHLLCLIFKTWWIALSKRPEVLYYLPASANKTPVIRDIIYLGAVRWCFPKTVFHYHAAGLPDYLAEAGFLGRLGSRVYADADVSIEICRTEYSPGRAFGARRAVIVPNGIDVAPAECAHAQKEKPVVLFVGALSEGKGVMELIETAELLAQKRPDVVFHLAGSWASQDFKQAAMQRISAAGLGEHFKFLGVLKGNDKWQAYAHADVFFFPSHYQSENFPMVLIEALACGLPIVTTRWRGIPQLMGDSDAAILCDIHAPDDYARELDVLLNDEQRRSLMSEAARIHYGSHFTRSQFIRSMEQVFDELLDRQNATTFVR